MQKRASIVAELYNDISSSDDDEEDQAESRGQEETKTASGPAKAASNEPKKASA